ncbi:uncharacterized protein [Apostichopus japonicus]|uniref:uncharacterized protein isoform X3 n=1 Tax=Stichopus japonicus TaxID=307972 RepID=UPI003AB8DAED
MNFARFLFKMNDKGLKGHSPMGIRKLLQIVSGLYCIILIVFIKPVKGINPCDGYGDEIKDTCPLGMYCNAPSGGTCQPCHYCDFPQVIKSQFISKCRCQNDGQFCKLEDRTAGAPIIQNIIDLNRYRQLERFSYVYDGNHTLQCTVRPITTQRSHVTTQPEPILTATQADNTSAFSVGTTITDNASQDGDRSAEKCKKLLPPDNGYIEKSNMTVGGVTVFRCNDTFTIDGTPELICKSDGEYSKDRPTCKKEQALFPTNRGVLVFFVIAVVAVAMGIVAMVAMCLYCRKKGRCNVQGSNSNLGPSPSDATNANNNIDETAERDQLLSEANLNTVENGQLPSTPDDSSSLRPSPSDATNADNNIDETAEVDQLLSGTEANLNTVENGQLPSTPGDSTNSSVSDEDNSTTVLCEDETGSSSQASVDIEMDRLTSTTTQVTMVPDSLEDIPSSNQEFCNCSLSLIKWREIESSLSTFLQDESSKRRFVERIFECSDGTTPCDITINGICQRDPQRDFTEILQDGMTLFNINTHRVMATALRSVKHGDEFSARPDLIDDLLQGLTRLEDCYSCRDDVVTTVLA